MKSHILSAFILVFLSQNLLGATCGSEGPQPLMVGLVPPKVKSISSVGDVKEYLLWEKRNTIFYRNDRDELRGIHRGTGFDKLYATSSFPLSRTSDPNERYLLSKENNYLLDTSNSYAWQKFDTSASELMHLFFNRGSLLSIDINNYLFGSQSLNVYDLKMSDPDFESKFQCSQAVGINGGLRLGSGHSYPYIFLYRVYSPSLLSRKRLAFYKMDVNTCRIEKIGDSTEPIPARVKSVYRFESIDAVAVQFDDPDYSLRWQQGNRCHYHSLGDKEAMFPSTDYPIMTLFDPQDGLQVVNLMMKKKIEVKRSDISEVSEEDFLIPSAGGSLYLSPTNAFQKRHLLEVEIPDIIP